MQHVQQPANHEKGDYPDERQRHFQNVISLILMWWMVYCHIILYNQKFKIKDQYSKIYVRAKLYCDW